MRIAITGHRPNKLGNDYDLTSELMNRIRLRILTILVDEHLSYIVAGEQMFRDCEFITGMALGIDTLFARIAIANDIRFVAAIPCFNQDQKWPRRSRKEYREIINNRLCTRHFVTKGFYDPGCMQRRNEWMVDNCDLLIAVWDGSSGGTANCVAYAKKKGKRIEYIDPNNYKT